MSLFTREMGQAGPEALAPIEGIKTRLGAEVPTPESVESLKLNQGLKFFTNRCCPFAQRAWFAALEKEVDFVPLGKDTATSGAMEYVHVELGPGGKPGWYTEQVNPFGTVPCIYDEGRGIFESMNVAEYLEEKFAGHGTSLLPAATGPAADPAARAAVRTLVGQFESKYLPTFYRLLLSPKADGEKRKGIEANIVSSLQEIEGYYRTQQPRNLSPGPYFLGSALSLVEISSMPFFDRLETILRHYRKFELFAPEHKVPLLTAALQAVRERPAFRASTQTPEYFIEIYKYYAAGGMKSEEWKEAAQRDVARWAKEEAQPSSKL